MAVTYEDIRAALDPDEPDYERAATLGADAAPHLSRLVRGDDLMLAAKAAYLAGRLGFGEVVNEAARRDDVTVRIAAANTARNLPGGIADLVLVKMIDDKDRGVRRAAIHSVRSRAGRGLQQRLRSRIDEEDDLSTRELLLKAVGRFREK